MSKPPPRRPQPNRDHTRSDRPHKPGTSRPSARPAGVRAKDAPTEASRPQRSGRDHATPEWAGRAKTSRPTGRPTRDRTQETTMETPRPQRSGRDHAKPEWSGRAKTSRPTGRPARDRAQEATTETPRHQPRQQRPGRDHAKPAWSGRVETPRPAARTMGVKAKTSPLDLPRRPQPTQDNDQTDDIKLSWVKPGWSSAPEPHRPTARSSGGRARSATSEAPRDSKKYGHLLYGLHAVREAWLNPARECRQLWLSGGMAEEFAATLVQAEERELHRPSPQRVERPVLDQMLPGAVHQGIVLDTAPLPETALETLLAQQPRLLVVLDQVTDPHNVGAIMRSAAAFGATGIILTERHAPSMTGTLAKTASGALEHIALVHVVNLARALDQLRDAGFWCVGLAEEGARNLGQLDLSGPTALVLGAEGEGLRRLTRERCDELARLPTQGAIGSLNVSNAAAVALYEARKQK